MGILIGALILILILLFQFIIERRSQRFQQRRSDESAQALAVGKKPQSLWEAWLWVSGATIVGFAGSAVLGLPVAHGALIVALFTTLYLEKVRYPKILITTRPGIVQVTHEELCATTVTISEESRILFDGQRLELRGEEKHKPLVLLHQDFPDVDLNALGQWLTEQQRDQGTSEIEKAATISGFIALAGISDLVFPQAGWSSRPLFLFVWVGLLIQALMRLLR